MSNWQQKTYIKYQKSLERNKNANQGNQNMPDVKINIPNKTPIANKVSWIACSTLLLLPTVILGIEEEITPNNWEDLSLPNKTLLIEKQVAITHDITISPSSSLRFVRGGEIKTTGNNLVINGGIDAGFFQIFDVSGGGFVFGNPQCPFIVPQWFGAEGNDNGQNDAIAFQNAIGLISPHGGTLYVPAGEYTFKSEVYIPYNANTEKRLPPNIRCNKAINVIGEAPGFANYFDSDKPKSAIYVQGKFPAFRINSKNDTTTILLVGGGNRYSHFQIKDLFIQNQSGIEGTGLYWLNVSNCVLENLNFSCLQYGINSAELPRDSYYERITLRNLRFSNISNTCFNGSNFNDALVIENCYITTTPTMCHTTVGFRSRESSGINVIGGIYNNCDTVFKFCDCSSINISGIYCEADYDKIFFFDMTSAASIQNSFFNLSKNVKLFHFDGDRISDIQFIGNRIRLPEDRPTQIFSATNPYSFTKSCDQVLFMNNQVGYWTGGHLANLNEYDITDSDKAYCKMYSGKTGLNLSGHLQVNGGDLCVQAKTKIYLDRESNTYLSYDGINIVLFKNGIKVAEW